jgi:hypothetical protein
MRYNGNLLKMRTRIGQPIAYGLQMEEGEVNMTDLLGQRISIHFDGRIFCVACGKRTNKAFGQGFCYPCFANAPENSDCILRPELCEGHLGKGRDPQWELDHHVQPHIVYLALSSGIKVGITRKTQLPTRWIDQGASQAIVLAEVPYRRLAGEMEVALKAHYSDKTNWQQMLKNIVSQDDIVQHKREATAHLAPELAAYVADTDEVLTLSYPALDWPTKVNSLKLEKQPLIEGVLTGIKAQYIILDNTNVINIRSHAGFHVHLHTD